MDEVKLVWALLTDPRRFGNTLYFNGETLEYLIGTDAWSVLEMLVRLEDAGLLKLTAPSDFKLLYEYELVKIKTVNFLGLKPADALVNELNRIWLIGRILKVDPPRQLGLRLPDYSDKFKNFNTLLNKLLKLMEAKTLVSKEVYERVVAAVTKDTSASVKEIKDPIVELNNLVDEIVKILNKFKEKQKEIEETFSKLGVKTETIMLLEEAYKIAEYDLREILLNVKSSIVNLLPIWERLVMTYDMIRAEFPMVGQDFFNTIETLRQVNNSLTTIMHTR
jgi:hypothetical protein